MAKDTVKYGIHAGLLGTIGDAIIHWSAFFVLGATTTGHYIAKLMFPNEPLTVFKIAIGVIVHFAAGAIVGVLQVYIYKRFGFDHPWYKGLGLAVSMWIIHVAVIPNIISLPRPILFRSPTESVVDLVAHLAYGVIATFYLVKTYTKTKV